MSVINMECRSGMELIIANNSIDSIVTDPPYGLSKQPNIEEVLKHWLAGDDYVHTGRGFMGKSWDSFVPGPSIWKEAYRVLKPGGYCLAFAGSRTADLMAMSLRLAGFEICDTIMWIYGSGFPKSMDIGKAIDKAAGAERKVIGSQTKARSTSGNSALPTVGGDTEYKTWDITKPATTEAQQWNGWGTALKPAHEPIIVARKPLDGTYVNNVLTHGCGALNIDACRVTDGTETGNEKPEYKANGGNDVYGKNMGGGSWENTNGRWPANFIHDGTLDEPWDKYFYCAKASKSDREYGMGDAQHHDAAECTDRQPDTAGLNSPRAGAGRTSGAKNIHPTVKPNTLMRWLVRLTTPQGGKILDPFTGSGSTGVAAIQEGFEFVGFEMTPEYFEIAERRINHAYLEELGAC